MPNIVIPPVVGSDGIVPIYQPEGRWCWWSLSEIYVGQVGQNKYVPKVNDYVMDYNTYTVYIVEYLDPVTLIPTLNEKRPSNMSFSLSETDVLFGVGPGTQSDTYRAYLDTSVLPYVLAVDSRLKVAGNMSNYAKIFKGADLSGSGTVVSKVYDSNGVFVSENVPLELVAIDSHVNYAIKTVNVCHTTEALVDGEIVTVVIYNDVGHVVSKRQLLIENTSFIRSANSSQKYITHISANCPFMSPTLDNTIDFPLNIPLNALNLMGTVHYSDGSTLTLPVDGSKFKMFGLDQYVSSIIGQKIELVLSYSLSPGEISYAGVGVNGNYITEAFDLITTNPNNSYTVKLFGYPYWVNASVGYNIKWWLFNLDRNMFFDVTPYVEFASNTGAFDPKGYGYLQRKAVSVNLRDISGAFKPFVHTQLVDIVLFSPPGDLTTAWTVSHESIGNRLPFGEGIYAKKIASDKIKIDSDITDFDIWKQKMYYNTYPLVNSAMEVGPMNPTHFIITYNNVSLEFAINEWDSILTINPVVTAYTNITIRFIKRVANNDLQLSMSVLTIRN